MQTACFVYVLFNAAQLGRYASHNGVNLKAGNIEPHDRLKPLWTGATAKFQFRHCRLHL
jgi:hypothetical protein